LSEDDTEAKAISLISWWNNGGSIPDNISDEVSSGYYLISYEKEADFKADQRKKYILLEDGTYELATTFADRFTDYYTTTFLTPKYKFVDDNNQPIQDPTLYLGML
jgi:hypothetical protein